MTDQRGTLTLKLGGNEVRYEADREAVEAQLEHIVDRLLRDAPAGGVRVALADVAPESSQAAEATPPAAPEALPEAQRLAQLYAVDDNGRLRLRKLPGRTADALLLVLYGMRKLRGRKWVHAPGMTAAARASGACFERADRLLAGYDDLVEGFGKRRAKRYRLTAAGREHCARLVEALVGPITTEEPAAAKPERAVGIDDPAAEADIPERVTARWDGELLRVSEAAERLGVDEAEVRSLRHRWELLGLPGGSRKRRRYFIPAFQIDTERRRIHPQAREANRLVSRRHTSWGIAKWWSSVEPELGRRPLELIGTPEADAVVRAARARFLRSA